jgi:hypothetical protein
MPGTALGATLPWVWACRVGATAAAQTPLSFSRTVVTLLVMTSLTVALARLSPPPSVRSLVRTPGLYPPNVAVAVALGFRLGDPIAGMAVTLFICHVG